MTVLVKFQIKIRFSIELHGNSKLSMTSCPPSSGYVDTHVYHLKLIVNSKTGEVCEFIYKCHFIFE